MVKAHAISRCNGWESSCGAGDQEGERETGCELCDRWREDESSGERGGEEGRVR